MRTLALPATRTLAGLALCAVCASAAFPRDSQPMAFPPPAEVRIDRLLPASSLGALEADVPLLWLAWDVARFFQGRRLDAFRVEDLEAELRREHPGLRVEDVPLVYHYVLINGELVRICYQPYEIVLDDGAENPAVLRFELSMPV